RGPFTDRGSPRRLPAGRGALGNRKWTAAAELAAPSKTRRQVRLVSLHTQTVLAETPSILDFLGGFTVREGTPAFLARRHRGVSTVHRTSTTWTGEEGPDPFPDA